MAMGELGGINLVIGEMQCSFSTATYSAHKLKTVYTVECSKYPSEIIFETLEKKIKKQV